MKKFTGMFMSALFMVAANTVLAAQAENGVRPPLSTLD